MQYHQPSEIKKIQHLFEIGTCRYQEVKILNEVIYKAGRSGKEHDDAMNIIADYTIHYTRPTHTYNFTADDQKCIYVTNGMLSGDLKEIRKWIIQG